MNSYSKHIIKNATIDFDYNGKTDGFALQQEVKDWFIEWLQLLEPEMNNMSAKDDMIAVDELALEVDVNGTNWKEEAAQKLIVQLKDKLLIMKKGVAALNTYKEYTVMQNFAETFLYFLQNGYLPWQATETGTNQWNEKLEQLFSQPDEGFIQKLKKLLTHSANSMERYLHIIPVQLSIHLFLSNNKQSTAVRQQLVHDLNLILHLAAVHHFTELTEVVHRLFLKVITKQLVQIHVKEDVIPLLQKRVIKFNELVQLMKAQTFQTDIIKEVQEQLLNGDKPVKQKKSNGETQIVEAVNDETKEIDLSKITIDENDAIYISNAGLILVAAFLPALFQKTGLVADDKITDYMMAACMTNYLSTGSINMEEFDLVLPKILCGLSPNVPLSTYQFHISNAMKKETDSMLTSAIEHWSILQNTSINSLRESFLRREGKLSFNGKEWHLTVEQKAFDLLLSHLPWNFSIIKLPWMNHLLKTQWNY